MVVCQPAGAEHWQSRQKTLVNHIAGCNVAGLTFQGSGLLTDNVGGHLLRGILINTFVSCMVSNRALLSTFLKNAISPAALIF
jgi:hypothetical protein